MTPSARALELLVGLSGVEVRTSAAMAFVFGNAARLELDRLRTAGARRELIEEAAAWVDAMSYAESAYRMSVNGAAGGHFASNEFAVADADVVTEEALTVQQVASRLGRSDRAVVRLLGERRLRGEKVGRQWFVRESEVATFEQRERMLHG